MKKYYVIYCENGFCGCEEEFYEEIEENEDINEIAEEILYNNYSFCEPDGRFIDGKSFDDEITEEEEEEYKENLNVWYKEISKGEYDANA